VSAFFCLGFWQFGQGAYIPAKAWVAQELMQRAWQKTASGRQQAVPWPWADTWPVARLSAKRGAVDLIVLEGGSGRTLAFGPGHLSVSVLPGEPGNSIIAGHRDTHFRFLQNLQLGETITVALPDGREHQYAVTNIDVVDATRGSLVLDTATPTMTLVTCYPFDARRAGGPLRYVVSASLLF
jgi:sortase A